MKRQVFPTSFDFAVAFNLQRITSFDVDSTEKMFKMIFANSVHGYVSLDREFLAFLSKSSHAF